MNKEEIIKYCNKFSISELDYIRDELEYIRNEKFDSTYKTVKVFPGSKLVEKIIEETGFYCYHRPCEGYSMGRGTHVIVIPIEKYSEELEQQLIKKYDE